MKVREEEQEDKKCKREAPNKEDKNAVSVRRAGSMREEYFVGHIPKNGCENVSGIVTYAHYCIKAEALG